MLPWYQFQNECYSYGSFSIDPTDCVSQTAAYIAAEKPVLSGHSKIDETKVLKTNGSLIKVESIAECSPREHSAIL